MTTSRRRASTPPRARGLVDTLELSFLHVLRSAEGETAPAALLWADGEGQWARLVTRLQTALPHLFVLGAYDFAKHSGRAIWLRCVVDCAFDDVPLEPGASSRFSTCRASRVRRCAPATSSRLQYSRAVKLAARERAQGGRS